MSAPEARLRVKQISLLSALGSVPMKQFIATWGPINPDLWELRSLKENIEIDSEAAVVFAEEKPIRGIRCVPMSCFRIGVVRQVETANR